MVYLVDDADDYRLLVQQVFTRFLPQYPVRLFASGYALQQQLLDNEDAGGLHERCQLVILDLHMDEQNGYQILQKLKAHPSWKSIPVVIMSHTRSQSEIEACYLAGANSFVSKVIYLPQLQQIFQALCHYWLDINQLQIDLR